MFLRPVAENSAPVVAIPDIDSVCGTFTDNFLRACAAP